jgi:hypothetical protein
MRRHYELVVLTRPHCRGSQGDGKSRLTTGILGYLCDSIITSKFRRRQWITFLKTKGIPSRISRLWATHQYLVEPQLLWILILRKKTSLLFVPRWGTRRQPHLLRRAAPYKTLKPKYDLLVADFQSQASRRTVPFQSIKCSQCEKVFKTVDLANYHAEKSGHDQFEESTEEVIILLMLIISLILILSHGVMEIIPLL